MNWIGTTETDKWKVAIKWYLEFDELPETTEGYLIMNAPRFVLQDDELYRESYRGPYLKCPIEE